jgi:iron complex transport system substrate-binding protein
MRPANGPVEIPERPERIVSLSATSTEILFAIGAGEQVAAVDETSNYPPEAPVTNLSGLDPNVEALVAYDPDLVVMSEDPGEVVASLEQLDVPPVVHPAAETFEDVYGQIEQLGRATGHNSEARDLVASMRTRIEELAGSVPPEANGLTYYHELDDTFFTVTSETFIGQVYGTVGLANIADSAKGASSGYPQLSAEYIIDENPDLIFLADTKCCGITAESVAERPGWNAIEAVRSGDVVPLDDDVASRWGPRVVDFLETVAAAVNARVEEAA